MPTERPQRERKRLWAVTACLLVCGFLLRLYFLRHMAFLATDSLLYQDIALNWLHHHVYGFSTTIQPRPTLIRLPGYPAILAGLDWVSQRFLVAAPTTLRSFLPVLWLQLFADLGTCCLVAGLARRIGSVRAGVAALALACLCPFTANYVAVPLTEIFTLFFLVMVFSALERWMTTRYTRWLLLLSFALAWSILLRPDQGLLAAAILPVLFFASWAESATILRRLRPVALCAVLTALPFTVWTARNWHTFHVFQPLAPKQAIDPGEVAPVHFEKWFRTWGMDFSASNDAYWNYPEDPVVVENLPSRAFDSAEQRERTVAVLKQAADAGRLDAQVESELEALAQERIAAHPLRYYVGLPAGRLMNMLLHPRTEMLPVPDRWWKYSEHRGQTLFALAYAALNLGYLLAAMAGLPRVLRRKKLLALSMAGYIAMRCMLLLTLDNAEQRYTLEFFPLLIVFASGLWLTQPITYPMKGSSADGP